MALFNFIKNYYFNIIVINLKDSILIFLEVIKGLHSIVGNNISGILLENEAILIHEDKARNTSHAKEHFDLLDSIISERHSEPRHAVKVLLEGFFVTVRADEDNLDLLFVFIPLFIKFSEDGGEVTAGGAPVGREVD